MSCSMSSNVTSGASDSSSSTRRSRSPRDNPDAGSSSIIRSGSVTTAMPTSSCRCSPWERSPTLDSRRSPSHTARRRLAARTRHCSSIERSPAAIGGGRGGPTTARYRLSSTVRPGKRRVRLVGAGDPEARPATGRQQRAVDALDPDLAGGRPDVAGHDVEQRRLAGSVGTEDRQPLALGDIEVDATQGEEATERDRHRAQPEQRRRGFSCGSDGVHGRRYVSAIPAERRRRRESRCRPTAGRAPRTLETHALAAACRR